MVDIFKHTVFHQKKTKNSSFFFEPTEKKKLYEKKCNVKSFFISNIKTERGEKFERIHQSKDFKTEEIDLNKKRRSFGILPLKYFSENIKSLKKY